MHDMDDGGFLCILSDIHDNISQKKNESLQLTIALLPSNSA